MRRIIPLLVLLAVVPLLVTACGSTKADVVAKNISLQAEEFQVPRRIVAINGITDKYLLEVTGYCSLETTDSGLTGAASITCKVGPTTYKKSYIYLSDNVTFVVEQIDPISVSAAHYTWLFRPGTLVPDIDSH